MSKLSTTSNSSTSSQFNTYTTPTYTLAHYQTPSLYTFVILTDPVQPPSRGLPARQGPEASGVAGAAGGGIPGSGGMSLPGVLKQLVAGPWVQWVVRNPAMRGTGGGLEYEEVEDEEEEEDEEETEGQEGEQVRSRVQKGQRRRGIDSDGFRHGVEAGE